IYIRYFYYRVLIFTICDKAAQLRGLFRFAGCGSPLLILRVAGPWPATVEENPGKGRNNGI
ncbi:TPA: hypothetical protein ACP48X_004313, partial [Escherichia coli]